MALKSLEEFNRDFIRGSFLPEANEPTVTESKSEQPKQQTINKKKRGTVAIASDVLFYLAILLILFTALTAGPSNGAPKMIFGYSYFTVLSASMQDEIPKGSFILVHNTDPQNLKTGDNITYLRNQNMSVTHKIISIYDNYEGSGDRGFETKGVNNANPDHEIVTGANIVGKVILVIPTLGAVMASLRTNIHLIFIMFGLTLILSFCLRGILAKPAKKAGVVYG